MKRFRSLNLFNLSLVIVLFLSGCTSEEITEEVVEVGEDSEEPQVDQDPSIIMNVSRTVVDFAYSKDNLSLYVKNDGDTDFDWNWDANAHTFLNLRPDSGSLSAGDSIAVSMSLDRTDLITQDYNLETFITNDFDQSIDLNIQFSHFIEEKWLIEGIVIDAEYDRNNDVIVVVSENPDELRVFKPSDHSVTSVALNLPPTSVSIGLDGNYAAVGHNGWFSYINLATKEIEENYAVTTNVYDLILAPNDWVYVFPTEDQWTQIRCINLLNGTETNHTGYSIYAETKARLHPSGNYIYGADNGLSPSDFEKYDIRNDTAALLYDSPYHGDFSFGGNIWISDDGSRLFARSRNVFNSSSDQSKDMTYNGRLVGEGQVMTLDFSSAAKKVYTIFSDSDYGWEQKPGNEIRKYETEFLAFKGTIELPSFFIPDENAGGKVFKSEGHFGFFNSAGTEYYVLVKVQEGSGAQNEWAIATIPVE